MQGDDDGGMWLDLLSFTWRHEVLQLLLPKEKEGGDAIIQCATPTIMPFCGDFFYSIMWNQIIN